MPISVRESYLANPKAFSQRMTARAADLWKEGYSVSICDQDTFYVLTPSGSENYMVAPLEIGCTCKYQQERQVPEVPCKHLKGIEALVDAQCMEYMRLYNRHKTTDPDWSQSFLKRGQALYAHWQEMLSNAERYARQAKEAEEKTDGKAFMRNLHTERDLLR